MNKLSPQLPGPTVAGLPPTLHSPQEPRADSAGWRPPGFHRTSTESTEQMKHKEHLDESSL